jgi:hypothetical protein
MSPIRMQKALSEVNYKCDCGDATLMYIKFYLNIFK